MADINCPEEFDELPAERQEFLLYWINSNLNPIQTFNKKHSSYSLKHLIEQETYCRNDIDLYFTNGQFKGAMLKSGYKVANINEKNWYFNVSENSPAIQRKNN